MSSAPVLISLFVGSYLVGAVPFGYIVGRLRGIDLFKEGSGNIGATNAGRVLGRGYGILVFILDFLKGAVPVAVIPPIATTIAPDAPAIFRIPDALSVGAAGFALLGHLYPIYLGFRGGKGVATGAGTVFVLVPGPAVLGLAAWAAVLLASRYVSLASLAAAVVLVLARLLLVHYPLGTDQLFVTGYCLIGATLVVVKHLANVRRLIAGTESRIGDWPMRQTLLRTLHVLAVGTWFGAAGFFNFVSAPLIFDSFEKVVNEGPSDRTANQTIISPDAPADDRKALASALAGSAVGPIFPKYFLLQAICGGVALMTAVSWWTAEGGRWVHRTRVLVLGTAVILVAVGWPVSEFVSQLRLDRFHLDPSIATAARSSFARWHLASLAMSGVVTLLAGVGLVLAGQLPTGTGMDPTAR